MGGPFSVATGISNAGIVVGFSRIPNELITHAFVYTTADGLQDLNSLITPALGFQLSEAFDVNELGQIVATGFVDGEPHTFLLTPTDGTNVADTGSSCTLLSCGLLGLLLLPVMRATVV